MERFDGTAHVADVCMGEREAGIGTMWNVDCGFIML